MNFGLYLTFIIVGLVLFGFVYIYSIRQQRQKRKSADDQLDALVDREPVTSDFEVSAKDYDDFVQHDSVLDKSVDSKVVPEASSSERTAPMTPEVRPLQGSVPSRREDSRRSSVHQQTTTSAGLVGGDSKNEQVTTNATPTNEVAQVQEQLVANDKSGNELDDKGRAEPSIDTVNVSGDAVNNTDDQAVEENEKPKALISELVARIAGDKPIARDDILAVFRRYDYLLARKMQVFGVHSLTNAWTDVELENEDTTFLDLGVSVQLADKTGALTRKELNTMSQMVLELAETFDRGFNFSMDLDEAIEQGRELDQLARKHCAMVMLNIVPKRKSGFRSSDFESCSRDLVMTQSDKGVFTRFRREGGRAFAEYNVAVADKEGKFRFVTKQKPFHIHNIVVYLNVPVVNNPVEVFGSMLDESRKLATWLDGKLVDNQRRNLTNKMVRKFTEQIETVESAMNEDGLRPGDPISQKLF